MSIKAKNMPEGWVGCRLGDGLILDIQPGFACGTHNRSGEGIVHLRPMNISSSGSISLSDVKYIPRIKADKETRLACKGDVLFNNTNSPELVGKTAYYYLDEPLAFSNHMTRLHCNSEILNPRFCAFFFHYKWLERYFLTICNKHVSQASVSRAKLEEMSLTLPPLLEQQRIAAKLDTIMPKIEAVNTGLERIPQIIKRFRQSVLTAAVTGKLTEQWREEHPEVESAEVLLERIQEEREKKYQEECEKAKQEGKKKPKKIRILSKIDFASINFEFPLNWTLTNLDSICVDIVDCPHSTPKWTANGEICLRTTNFLPNKLDWSEVKYVSQETYTKRIERLKPQRGDILYSREGGILGVACILDRDIDVCLGQRMMLMRTSSYISNSYILYLLNSPIILHHVNSLIGGSASPHINVGAIKNFPIPLPPLEEQQEIVRQVDRLFAFADKLEAHYHNAKAKVEKLPQSVLAKAFRGELVSQDPDDEPAEKLLERIKAEKVRLEKKGKKV